MKRNDLWLFFSFEEEKVLQDYDLETIVSDCGGAVTAVRQEIVVFLILKKLNNIITKNELIELLTDADFTKRLKTEESTNAFGEIIKVVVFFDNELLATFHEFENFDITETYIQLNMPYTAEYTYNIDEANASLALKSSTAYVN